MSKPLDESIGDTNLDERDPHAHDEEPDRDAPQPTLVDELWRIGTGKTLTEWNRGK